MALVVIVNFWLANYKFLNFIHNFTTFYQKTLTFLWRNYRNFLWLCSFRMTFSFTISLLKILRGAGHLNHPQLSHSQQSPVEIGLDETLWFQQRYSTWCLHSIRNLSNNLNLSPFIWHSWWLLYIVWIHTCQTFRDAVRIILAVHLQVMW